MNSSMQPAILALGTAVPPYGAAQEEIGAWMGASFSDQPAVARLIRSLYAYSGIERRYGCTPEYIQSPETSRFAPGRALADSPTTAERLAIYQQEAPGLAAAAVRRALADYAERAELDVDELTKSITHLIVVSCTGFFAPGPDFVLAHELGLTPAVNRTVIGFMGCSAAFNGLRAAREAILADPNARALVVAVELCSLHIQPGKRRDDLVSASLFADGAAAALVAMPEADDGNYFALDGFRTDMKPNTSDEMVWRIGNHGFTLRLSPRIPDHLTEVAPAALAALMGARRPDFWAIHPGGRAIVDGLQELFDLDDAAVSASRTVLRNFGNISSATILFVLHEQAQALAQATAAATGVAMAFGPGLTVEMAQLTYVPVSTPHAYRASCAGENPGEQIEVAAKAPLS